VGSLIREDHMSPISMPNQVLLAEISASAFHRNCEFNLPSDRTIQTLELASGLLNSCRLEMVHIWEKLDHFCRECFTGQIPVLKSPRFDEVHMHFSQRRWSSWFTRWHRGCAPHDGESAGSWLMRIVNGIDAFQSKFQALEKVLTRGSKFLGKCFVSIGSSFSGYTIDK
jgi:hypothetical protein